MKLSENWLRSWVSPPTDTRGLAEQLTMAGLEVDSIESSGATDERIVVGVISGTSPHPDAHHLTVCRVEAGASKPLQIVCGAPNARPGLHTAVALEGAKLPAGQIIARTELRGVDSCGMLCSAAELGLQAESGGLIELPDDAPPGRTLTDYLALDDRVLDIEFTPNRGDCLSVAGVARELAVINRLPIEAADCPPVEAGVPALRPVHIDIPEACPRYLGRIVDGVDGEAPTPPWLRERLRRSDVNSVSALVDVTNYVMLELGQPMHAFDDASLSGGIVVRWAEAGEQLTLLDRSTVDLVDDCMVIADESGPVAFAGLMGGLRTSVTSGTHRVFLESACFSPFAVAGRGRRYKVGSDALYRYERGVDPDLQRRALERATRLIIDICGGKPGPVVESDERPAGGAPTVDLRPARVEKLLGSRIPHDEIEDILLRLGMSVAKQPDRWRISPPSYRHDISREADLIEEIARIHGYNALPSRPRHIQGNFKPASEKRRGCERARQVLIQRGYFEVITYSFVDSALQAEICPDKEVIDLDNPIASQYAQMRASLWCSLLPVWRHNTQRRHRRLCLFEIGRRFWSGDRGIEQPQAMAGVISGSRAPDHWSGKPVPADFFDLKAHVTALFAGSDGGGRLQWEARAHPALHPGESARITLDQKVVGWAGRVHPRLSPRLETTVLPLVFELDLAVVLRTEVPSYRALSEFPPVRRDLAVVVEVSMAAGQVAATARRHGGEILQNIHIFDVFRGGSLQAGSKSVALGLIFQDNSRTLIDDEVDAQVRRMQDGLARDLGATIRG